MGWMCFHAWVRSSSISDVKRREACLRSVPCVTTEVSVVCALSLIDELGNLLSCSRWQATVFETSKVLWKLFSAARRTQPGDVKELPRIDRCVTMSKQIINIIEKVGLKKLLTMFNSDLFTHQKVLTTILKKTDKTMYRLEFNVTPPSNQWNVAPGDAAERQKSRGSESW